MTSILDQYAEETVPEEVVIKKKARGEEESYRFCGSRRKT